MRPRPHQFWQFPEHPEPPLVVDVVHEPQQMDDGEGGAGELQGEEEGGGEEQEGVDAGDVWGEKGGLKFYDFCNF